MNELCSTASRFWQALSCKAVRGITSTLKREVRVSVLGSVVIAVFSAPFTTCRAFDGSYR